MNNCNSNGFCGEQTNGQCICVAGWLGADCSVKV